MPTTFGEQSTWYREKGSAVKMHLSGIKKPQTMLRFFGPEIEPGLSLLHVACTNQATYLRGFSHRRQRGSRMDHCLEHCGYTN